MTVKGIPGKMAVMADDEIPAPIDHRTEALRLVRVNASADPGVALHALTHAVLALADETAQVAAEINQLFPIVASDSTPIVTTQTL